MRSFRTICNKAINLDYVNLNWYPFRKYKIKKGKTTPRVMSIKELTSYFKLDLSPENPLYKAWLIGKLIFLLRGINLKDLLLLKPSNIVQGRIVYKRAKTGKLYSIEIHSGIQEILDLFKANETLLGIFTNEEINNKIRPLEILTQKRKVVNNHLKKIGKLINSSEEITTYVFRYSYANTAKKLGYSKDLIAEALGHEYGNTVTGIYLEMFDNEMLDEMNRCIFNKINTII
jgi:integrase